MRLRHVVPFLLLFAWQVAPPTNPRARPSRLRLWFGRGTSSYDYAYWGTGGGGCINPDPASCSGCTSFYPTYPLLNEARNKTSTAGIHVDAWPSPAMRVSAAYGWADLGGGNTPAFAGGLVAWEGRLAGLGGGWASGSAHVGYEGLATYARLGSLHGPQLRADLRAPTATPGVTGWARAGFAYNQQGRQENIAIFLGISAVEASPDTTYQAYPGSTLARVTRPAFFADVTLPLGQHLDGFGRVHFAKKARSWGFGLALRLGP